MAIGTRPLLGRPSIRTGVVTLGVAVVVATGLPLAPATPGAPTIESEVIPLVGDVVDDVAVIARSGSAPEAAPDGAPASAHAASVQEASPTAGAGTGAPLPSTTPVGFAAAVALDGDQQSVILDWDAHPAGDIVEFEVRSLTEGAWSPWVHVVAAPDEAPDDAAPPTSAGPVWVGDGTETVEVRLVEGAPSGLRLEALDIDVPAGGAGIGGAEAAPAAPAIRSNDSWGHRGWASSNGGCGAAPTYARQLEYAIVHHSVTTNNYSQAQVPAQILSIYHQHVNNNGWCDIAYNFVVDRFGGVWEGREGGADRAVIGGHARGFNTASTGVVLLGQHHPGASPAAASVSSAQRASLRRLLAWKLSIHGVDANKPLTVTSLCTGSCRFGNGTQVSLPRVTTHRAVGLTACPGDLTQSALAGMLGQVASDVAAASPMPLFDWPRNQTGPAVLTADGRGGVRPHGAAAPVAQSSHWGTWNIARSITGRGGQGYLLDGYGGLHPYGGAPAAPLSNYWPGWDIARDVASGDDPRSGYVLDGYGGLNPYGGAPHRQTGGYWPGWDIARAVAVDPTGRAGYVLDGWGGLHPFGGAPARSHAGYAPGRDVAVDVVLRPDGTSGYVLARSGAIHAFGGAPAMTIGTPWPGRDVARGIDLLADGSGGYVVDHDGVLHAFGSAPPLGPSHTHVGLPINRGVVVQ